MKNNKKYVPSSRQIKTNTFKNIWALSFWLIFCVSLAILFNHLLTNVFSESKVSNMIVNNSQFMYTLWTVQATVTVLSFFISNIMTSIVKDVFYGLSIKDILTARGKWFEISFWQQSIMSILLVLVNIPFVIATDVPAVLVIASFNLLFIIYMLNNAFSYVFNSRVIVNRVDKIVQKEILTGKTILDLNQLLLSLDNETRRRITNNDLKKANYNINFMLRIYVSLKQNKKTSSLNTNLKVIKNALLHLIKTNNFEMLNSCLDGAVRQHLSESEYSEVVCDLIESVSVRIVNYSMLELEEYKVHDHIVNWSKLSGSKNFVDSVSNSFYNYFNSILLNTKVNTAIKNKLLTGLFNTLTHPQTDNTEQQKAFKVSLMHIAKEAIINNNKKEFQELVNILNLDSFEDKAYNQEIITLLNTYIFYLASNKNINPNIAKNANEFLHMEPNTMELESLTLAEMLKNSNARYIKHFWSAVDTVDKFNSTSKPSLFNISQSFDDTVLTKFYLIYWKLFANSLENISLNLTEFNENYYSQTVLNFIRNVKEDEDCDYQLFKEFCHLYQIDYDELRAQEHWVENADKIDEYIRDIYIEHLTNTALNNQSRLNILGTRKQEEQLLNQFIETAAELPLYSNDLLGEQESLTVPFIIKTNKLIDVDLSDSTITEYTNQFKQIAITQIQEKLSALKIRPLTYNKIRANLRKLIDKFEKAGVNAITHNLSNNIDVLNNAKDEDYIKPLIAKEEQYQVLNELELNEYLFINTNNTSISLTPLSLNFRQPNEQEVKKLIAGYKTKTSKNKNAYKIEEYYGTYEQALNYYSSVYLIADLTINLSIELNKSNIIKVEIK